MDFKWSPLADDIRQGIRRLCARFDDEYWEEKDRNAEFPWEFYDAVVEGGWMGVTIPTSYGGGGLGILEASIIEQEIAASGAGMNGCSAVHIGLFGFDPILRHGSDSLKERFLPPFLDGSLHISFAVTEPDAGTDTSSISTFARKVDGGYVRPIAKLGRHAVDSNELFIDDLFVPDSDVVGEVGNGFKVMLTGLNAERVIAANAALGIGRAAIRRAVGYATERIVFDRPIGQNQAVQHPLAEAQMRLDAAELMCLQAAWLFDQGLPCGKEANMAKYLAAEAGFFAADVAVQTHGGYGYAREYHVERYFREARLMRIAPISQEMVLNYIGSHVLGLPKSY